MKKLNNKGVTLIELIVSFALISIAAVYFYKTLDVVVSLYKTATEETQKFVDKNYAIRIAEKLVEKNQSVDKNSYNLDSYAPGYSIDEVSKIYGDNYKIKLKDGTVFYYSKPSSYPYVSPTPSVCTIEYNSMDGSPVASSSFTCDAANFTITSEKTTKTGFKFNGWNTKSDATGILYESSRSYSNNDKKSFTLYAMWEENSSQPAVDSNSIDIYNELKKIKQSSIYNDFVSSNLLSSEEIELDENSYKNIYAYFKKNNDRIVKIYLIMYNNNLKSTPSNTIEFWFKYKMNYPGMEDLHWSLKEYTYNPLDDTFKDGTSK